jgi:hypothetical protein
MPCLLAAWPPMVSHIIFGFLHLLAPVSLRCAPSVYPFISCMFAALQCYIAAPKSRPSHVGKIAKPCVALMLPWLGCQFSNLMLCSAPTYWELTAVRCCQRNAAVPRMLCAGTSVVAWHTHDSDHLCKGMAPARRRASGGSLTDPCLTASVPSCCLLPCPAPPRSAAEAAAVQDPRGNQRWRRTGVESNLCAHRLVLQRQRRRSSACRPVPGCHGAPPTHACPFYAQCNAPLALARWAASASAAGVLPCQKRGAYWRARCGCSSTE